MSNFRALLREVKYAVESWRTNFWFFPFIMGIGSLILFAVTIWVDYEIAPRISEIRELPFWFTGDPEASRSLLNAIAATIGTIATVVFSISILTLQLASSEYTPKLLQNFTRSSISQITLGAFATTVIFAILTLSVVREEAAGQESFVPIIAINLTKLFALTSLGLLIFFIGHIAILISPSHIIAGIRKDAVRAYRDFIENKVGEDAPQMDEPPDGDSWKITAAKSGYIQRIRLTKLLLAAKEIAESGEENARIITPVIIGDYVKQGDTLAEISVNKSSKARDSIREAFIIGENRISEEDFRYGIDELTSISLRRIKQMDPDTAEECVSALVEICLNMMNTPIYPPNRWIIIEEERVHLAMPPIDINLEFTQAFQLIQEHALGQNMLVELATEISEGLSTIAKESASGDFTETFEKVCPALVWSAVKIIENSDNPELLRRVSRALENLKPTVESKYPVCWADFKRTIETNALKYGRMEYFENLVG